MIKVTTRNGFEVEVRENIGNDWKVLKALSSLKRADEALDQFAAYSDLVNEILGAEGEKNLCDFLEKKFGYVPTDEMEASVTDIFDAIAATKEGKN